MPCAGQLVELGACAGKVANTHTNLVRHKRFRACSLGKLVGELQTSHVRM